MLPMDTTTKILIPNDNDNENAGFNSQFCWGSLGVRLLAVFIVCVSNALTVSILASFLQKGWYAYVVVISSVIAGVILEAMCWVSATPRVSE